MSAGNGAGLRIAPLGGLGEIGMNCLALEQRGEILLVDCGVTFPTTDSGVDVLHPRFDHVLEREGALRGIVLTHGHEDHIGAVPYLLREVDVPVYGPAYALELVKRRLDEHGFRPGDVKLVETPLRRAYEVGSFTVEPLRVTHSIVDATGLAISTDAGLVVHTGDFKLDASPPDGETTDLARFAELGREGVRLLFSDSTNTDAPGVSESEAEVGVALEGVIAAQKGRVFIGMFASNVHRLRMVGEIAQRTGRRICLLGRSVQTHVQVAKSVGRLPWPSDLVVSPEIAASYPRDRVLVVASGTQAERGSGLVRLAAGTHPVLKIERGDLVLLSSRIIPGNDRAVVGLWGDLLRSGAELVTWTANRKIHASGHAHREEQRRMLDLVGPEAFVPVHGTRYHLTRHAALANEIGVGDVMVVENGERVELAPGAPLRRSGRIPSGRVATFGGEPIEPEVLTERAQVGRAGVVFVALAVRRDGTLAGSPRVLARGVQGSEAPDFPARVADAASRAAAKVDPAARADDASLCEAVRLAARRAVEDLSGTRPVVGVSVTRVG